MHTLWDRSAVPLESLNSTNDPLSYIVLVISIMNMARGGRQYQQYGCSGTLIRPHLVLTTASCLYVQGQDNPTYEDTMVVSRITQLQYKATWFYIHPEFHHSSDFNIAVVEIERVEEDIALPTLPTSLLDFWAMKDTCVLGGYGNLQQLSINNFHSVKIQDTKLRELTCRKTSNPFMICMHFENLYPCAGDIGAPLVCNGELFAIFTPKYMIKPGLCKDRYGAIFTPVHPFVEDWLNRILDADHHDNLEWMNNPLNILFLSGVVLALIGVIYYLIIGWINRRTGRQMGSSSYRVSSISDSRRTYSFDS